jgi:hypothetical protein
MTACWGQAQSNAAPRGPGQTLGAASCSRVGPRWVGVVAVEDGHRRVATVTSLDAVTGRAPPSFVGEAGCMTLQAAKGMREELAGP